MELAPPPQLEDLAPQDAAISDTNCKSILIPYQCYKVWGGSYNSNLRFDLLEWLTELRKTLYVIYWFTAQISQKEGMYRARWGCGGVQSFHYLPSTLI